MSNEALAALTTDVQMLEVQRQEVVYLPGDPGESVFFIDHGRIKCSKISRDGKELTLIYHSAGELFGEQCLFDGGPREEMAEAVAKTLLMVMPRSCLLAMLGKNAALAVNFANLLSHRRRHMETRLEHLVFRDVDAKLAALLLELGQEYGVETAKGIQIGLKITHQEMANLIGSTRETISLTLAQFKRKNLIELSGRNVFLLDMTGLAALT